MTHKTAMHADIDPLQAHRPALAYGRAQRSTADSGPLGALLARTRASYLLSSDALPAAPPPQLTERIAAAARAWESLAASGRHLVFGEGANGRVSIELHDDRGSLLAALAPAQLFDLIDAEARV